MKSAESGTYAHGVVAISVAVHDEVWGLWSPCGGSSIKKVGPGEIENMRRISFLQLTESELMRWVTARMPELRWRRMVEGRGWRAKRQCKMRREEEQPRSIIRSRRAESRLPIIPIKCSSSDHRLLALSYLLLPYDYILIYRHESPIHIYPALARSHRSTISCFAVQRKRDELARSKREY